MSGKIHFSARDQSDALKQEVLDRFAAAFLTGFVAHSGTGMGLGIPYGKERERLAAMVFDYAEAMMVERNRRNCVGTIVTHEDED